METASWNTIKLKVPKTQSAKTRFARKLQISNYNLQKIHKFKTQNAKLVIGFNITNYPIWPFGIFVLWHFTSVASGYIHLFHLNIPTINSTITAIDIIMLQKCSILVNASVNGS